VEEATRGARKSSAVDARARSRYVVRVDSRAFVELLRWLGPWTPATDAPSGIERREVAEGKTRVSLWSAGGTPRAAVLVLPGLHHDGIDDPRLDRLARVLARAGAHAGTVVVAPDVRAFRRLELDPQALVDAEAALAVARRESATGHPYIGAFSISFGSILALHLAARHGLARLVVFGGYHRVDEALRFALAGDGARRGDPLNGPAVVLNLAPELLPPEDVSPYAAAARDFCRRTWGRVELKSARRHAHAAWDVLAAHPLRPAARELLLQATGLAPGILVRAEGALAAARARFAWLDPSPLVPDVGSAVTLVHGRDDDVIPYTHAESLARVLPRARAFITGLYGHTGHTGQAAAAAAVVAEVRTLAGMLRALATLVTPA